MFKINININKGVFAKFDVRNGNVDLDSRAALHETKGKHYREKLLFSSSNESQCGSKKRSLQLGCFKIIYYEQIFYV